MVKEADDLSPDSLLDRLIDYDPELSQDAARSNIARLQDLKLSVRRNLEALLNTRRPYQTWSASSAELPRSMLAYGVPDVSDSAADLMTTRERLRAAVEQALRTFEPRLKAVRVSIARSEQESDRTLRFRIEAVIRRGGILDPIAFESVLQPASGAFDISRPLR